MYGNPYLENNRLHVSRASEIDAKVRAQEEEAIVLAHWYTDQTRPHSPRTFIPVQKLFKVASSFIESLRAAPQGELAQASHK